MERAGAAGGRSIGEYLCAPRFAPPVVDIDELPWDDIRQDACLRAIVALRRAGKAIGPDAVAAFDAEPRLVRAAYGRARTDALRELMGRGSEPWRIPWNRLVSLENGLAEVADPRQAEDFEEIVRRLSDVARLVALLQRRSGGVSAKTMRKVLIGMRTIQRMRASGIATVPPKLRMLLARARQRTGLALDVEQL